LSREIESFNLEDGYYPISHREHTVP